MLVTTPGSTLILSQIGEPSNNDLRLIVIEVRPQGNLVDSSLGPVRPILPDSASKGFEITWWRYVAYAVRNESFFKPERSEQSGQGLSGTRDDTAFLEYVRATTFATDDYPGPLSHWFVYTEWHCIDVVSDTPPNIRELGRAEVDAAIQQGFG